MRNRPRRGGFYRSAQLRVLVLPKSFVDRFVAANPAFAEMVYGNPFRNGFYRASSVFTVPLSYGEFAAMVAPIGGYFIVHGEKYGERVLGVLVFFGAVVSLFVSGARGGNVAFIVSMTVFLALWVVRYMRGHPRSMVGPLLGVLASIATFSFIGLVITWPRLRVMVLGGGDANRAILRVWINCAWRCRILQPTRLQGMAWPVHHN